MRRVVLVCPGRGSYSRETLGSLAATPSGAAADAFRAALGRPTPTAMDAAEGFVSRLHLAGENASILTMACTLADADRVSGVEVVGVIGNSMGWYTALAVAGALPLADAFRLVETMAQYQAGNVVGGQVLYPLVDEQWRPLPSPELDAAMLATPDLHPSIRLGGQIVLGGSNAAVAAILRLLPPRRIGERDAPMQLPLHSAFHTPLMAATGARARRELADLAFQAPRVPLVDGRGAVWWPRHADPAGLAAWTLGAQIDTVFDFTRAVQVAMAELAPDALVLLGPGGNLGGAVAQALIAEGWRGLHDRQGFLDRQRVDPVVLAMNRPEQRALVT